MRKPFIALAVVALAVASVPTLASAQHASMTMKYTIKLNGKFEKPAKGDLKGSGKAVIKLDSGKRTVCFSIRVKSIKLPAEAAHIHAGKAGVSGNVLITLAPPKKNGKVSGCVSHVNSNLIKAMEKHPASYYVNVHTSDYPLGAVRGQL